jgi:hypothetical protein
VIVNEYVSVDPAVVNVPVMPTDGLRVYETELVPVHEVLFCITCVIRRDAIAAWVAWVTLLRESVPASKESLLKLTIPE